MNLEKKIIQVRNRSDLPGIQEIKSIPRGMAVKVIFGERVVSIRESIGKKWQKKLPEFQVGIHTVKEEINILKLITDEEIEQNQLFFEECAKEYGELGERLMKQFESEFDVVLVRGRPIVMQNTTGKKPFVSSGKMGNWIFSFHGIHCGFRNIKTNQQLEVPLNYGGRVWTVGPILFLYIHSDYAKIQPTSCENL